MIEILKALIPTQTQIEWGVVASMLGTTVSYVIGFDGAVIALLYLMLVDYITGLIAAVLNANMKLDSSKGFKGILKKFVIILLVSMSHVLDTTIGIDLIQSLVVWFYLGNEGISVLENAANAGLPVPNKLKETLEQFKEGKTHESCN